MYSYTLDNEIFLPHIPRLPALRNIVLLENGVCCNELSKAAKKKNILMCSLNYSLISVMAVNIIMPYVIHKIVANKRCPKRN